MLNFTVSFVKETEDKSKLHDKDDGGDTRGSQSSSAPPGNFWIYKHYHINHTVTLVS